jgi:hypothetical protein
LPEQILGFRRVPTQVKPIRSLGVLDPLERSVTKALSLGQVRVHAGVDVAGWFLSVNQAAESIKDRYYLVAGVAQEIVDSEVGLAILIQINPVVASRRDNLMNGGVNNSGLGGLR